MGFNIKDGVLYKYTEEPKVTKATIPDSVTKISMEAFADCTSLIAVTIPDSVTEIDSNAFTGCTSLETIHVSKDFTALNSYHVSDTKWYKESTDDFVILGANLLAYRGNESVVIIPDSVKTIETRAFRDFKNLTSVTIPESVTIIDSSAFEGCEKQVVEFAHGISHLTDDTLKEFVIPNWKIIKPRSIAELFVTKHSKPMLKLYAAFSGKELNAVGEEISTLLGDNPSAKQCSAAGDFITMFYAEVDADILKRLFEVISSSKAGEKAVGVIKEKALIMKKLGIKTS